MMFEFGDKVVIVNSAQTEFIGKVGVILKKGTISYEVIFERPIAIWSTLLNGYKSERIIWIPPRCLEKYVERTNIEDEVLDFMQYIEKRWGGKKE